MAAAEMNMLYTSDIVAIEQLYALYCHICDAREFDRFEEIFAPDVHYDMTAYGFALVNGTDEMRVAYSKIPLPPSHQNSSVYVYEQDTEVRVKAKTFHAGPNDEFLSSDVNDVLERRPEGWRIIRRVFVPRGRVANFKENPWTFS